MNLPGIVSRHKIPFAFFAIHSFLVIATATLVAVSNDSEALMAWCVFIMGIDLPIATFTWFLAGQTNASLALVSFIFGGCQWVLIGLFVEWALYPFRHIIRGVWIHLRGNLSASGRHEENEKSRPSHD